MDNCIKIYNYQDAPDHYKNKISCLTICNGDLIVVLPPRMSLPNFLSLRIMSINIDPVTEEKYLLCAESYPQKREF